MKRILSILFLYPHSSAKEVVKDGAIIWLIAHALLLTGSHPKPEFLQISAKLSMVILSLMFIDFIVIRLYK